MNLVEARFSLKILQVVDFYGEGTQGTYNMEHGVRLARKILADREKLMAVLVHEVAHMDAPVDGSAEHRDGCDSIFAKIVVQVCK